MRFRGGELLQPGIVCREPMPPDATSIQGQLTSPAARPRGGLRQRHVDKDFRRDAGAGVGHHSGRRTWATLTRVARRAGT
jgi:hypothetical protein